MKIDFKSISIIVLLITTCFFVYKSMFNNVDVISKDVYEKLNNDFIILKYQKNENDEKIKSLMTGYDSIVKLDLKLKLDIYELDKKILIYNRESIKSEKYLKDIIYKQIEFRNRIELLQNNPVNRVDDELLISINN